LPYLGWQEKLVREVPFVEDMLRLLHLQIKQFRNEVFNLGGGAANSVSLRKPTSAVQQVSSRNAPISQSDKARHGKIVLYCIDHRNAAQQPSWKLKTDLRTGFTRIFSGVRENEEELRGRTTALLRLFQLVRGSELLKTLKPEFVRRSQNYRKFPRSRESSSMRR
jgi:hypothetical protein